jgi:hypothetical protein
VSEKQKKKLQEAASKLYINDADKDVFKNHFDRNKTIDMVRKKIKTKEAA